METALSANAILTPPEPPAPPPWPEELERGGFTRAAAPEDFDRVCRAAADLESGTIRALLFTGRAGCGKTLAATIIARRVFFQTDIALGCVPDTAHLKPFVLRGYQVPQLEDDDMRRQTCFRRAMLGDIVLDDIGTESPALVYGTPTDLVPEFLASYCDRDYTSRRAIVPRVIVTTNLDGNGIRARYGERILSRLLETFAWLPFKGGDKREKKAMVY